MLSMLTLAQSILKKELAVDDVIELPSNEFKNIEQVILECQHEYGHALKPVYDALAGAYEMGVLRCIKASMDAL